MPARLISLSLLLSLSPLVGNGWLGVIPDQNATRPTIAEVIPGSPAEEAGLQPDDIFVAVGGTRVDTVEAFVAAIQAHDAGDVVEIEIERGGATRSVRATLAARPRASGPPAPRAETPPAKAPAEPRTRRTSADDDGVRPAAPGGTAVPPSAAPQPAAPDGAPTAGAAAALLRARATGRPVLVVFAAPWCAACQRLEQALELPAVRALLEAYERVEVDTDREAGLADRFGVAAIPHLAILAPDGTTTRVHVGDATAAELSAFLQPQAAPPAAARRAALQDLVREVRALRAELRALKELVRAQTDGGR